MNYPNGKKGQTKNNIFYSNRGMSLENEINVANEYYLLINKAVIHKKPIPIKVTKVHYPSRDKTIIKEAFFTIPSTTDYNGIYKGKYIDFDAKETKSKTALTLRNIHPHQIEHLKKVYEHGGISFIIVRFTTLNKTFLLKSELLIEFIKKEKRQSIPIKYFEENTYLIEDSLKPTIDYLKIIDKIIKE